MTQKRLRFTVTLSVYPTVKNAVTKSIKLFLVTVQSILEQSGVAIEITVLVDLIKRYKHL